MITRLPDDIEQYLLNGQRTRATYALMARRNLSLTQARTVIGRWLSERYNELRSDPSFPRDDDWWDRSSTISETFTEPAP